jgi:hypothetical protein
MLSAYRSTCVAWLRSNRSNGLWSNLDLHASRPDFDPRDLGESRRSFESSRSFEHLLHLSDAVKS